MELEYRHLPDPNLLKFSQAAISSTITTPRSEPEMFPVGVRCNKWVYLRDLHKAKLGGQHTSKHFWNSLGDSHH